MSPFPASTSSNISNVPARFSASDEFPQQEAFKLDPKPRPLDSISLIEFGNKAVVSRRRAGVSSGDMINDKLLGRITANPEIFGGKPIIRGMRISVEMILSLLAQGEKEEAILADYPDLEPDDLRACLAYAHAAISHDKLDSLHIPA